MKRTRDRSVSTGGDGKLALVEHLLVSDDFAACAQRGVDWLGEHAPIEQALCVALVTDPSRLFGIAGYRVSAGEVAEYSVLAEARESLLGRALHARKPVFIADSDGSIPIPFGGKPFYAFPLRSGHLNEDQATGLLLIAPRDGLPAEARWLASVLGEKLARVRNVTDLGRAAEGLRENYRQLRVAQAEVRAQRHRLDLIIDSVADPILVTDPAGDIVLLNAPAEKLFTVRLGSSPEAKARVRANDAHFSSFVSNLLFSGSDERHRGEIGLVDPRTNGVLPVEAIAGKILSEHGELAAVVTILHDRTEQLEKDELLRRQAIDLEQASALKSQFLANMSHEFRTPLNAILGYTHMLLAGVNGPLARAQQRSLGRIDSNSKHLLSIIDEILDITRIEAGRMPIHASEFELPAVIAEVMSELAPIIARSKLEIRTELEPDLPPLRNDRQKIKQIVLNLLSNAIKFTHKGTVTIQASCRRSDNVTIAISDMGIGIAPRDHERVFEDFQQVDTSTTRHYAGTGLGLSLCRRLANMLDGKITLVSELGKGSTFTLVVPRRVRSRPRR